MMNDAAPDRRRPLKHRLKLALRAAFARVVYHARLHRLIGRVAGRGRLTILALHNVEDPPATDFLPGDMKTPQALFDRLVRVLASNFETCTVSEGARALASGSLRGPAVAISLDDGYRDNLRVGLPILRRHGARGTVYVEAAAVGDRKLSWTHAYFWVVDRRGFEFFLDAYRRLSHDAPAIARLDAEAKAGGDLRYHLKRILKYHADVADRDRVCLEILREAGGDPGAVAEGLYLSPAEVAELDRAGVEVGAHTVTHPILARCADADVEREILDGRRRLESWLGHPVASFAYPWGRRWDYDERAVRVLDRAGFDAAVSMDPGTNLPGADRLQLKRYAVDSGVSIPDLVAEASGAFDWLRRWTGVRL